MQLLYDKSKFKNNFFLWESSNVSSVLKRTADICESKELTDKQPLFFKSRCRYSKDYSPYRTVMGKTVKMCDIQK
jgi:hypothetical protein